MPSRIRPTACAARLLLAQAQALVDLEERQIAQEQRQAAHQLTC